MAKDHAEHREHEELADEPAGRIGAHEQVVGAPTDRFSVNTAPAGPGATANAEAAKVEPPETFAPARAENAEGGILDVSPADEEAAEEDETP